MTTAQKLMTADELLLMPRDKNDCSFELVRGVLTEPVPPHFNPHGIASARFGFVLTKYTVDTDVGVVTGRAGFHLEENPDTVRAPDIGWVAPGRIVEGSVSGYLPLAPDLAVEIKESYEAQRDMAERAAMWLDFGTQMVWVGDPKRTTVTRYRPGQNPVTLYEDDVLDGGDLLPGFSVPVWRLFRRHR